MLTAIYVSIKNRDFGMIKSKPSIHQTWNGSEQNEMNQTERANNFTYRTSLQYFAMTEFHRHLNN